MADNSISADEVERRVAERSEQLKTKIAELMTANAKLGRTSKLVEAMLENIPDRIYFKDADSRFLKLSRTLARHYHLSDARVAIGKTDFDFTSPEKAREIYEDEQRIIRTGEALVNKVEKQTLATGETVWSSSTKVPLRDTDGKVIGIVGVNRDITDLKNAEVKIEQINKELREVSRQAGMAEVATGVLHNVGNVLNSVNVAADLIAERLRNSKAAGVSRLSKMLLDHESDLPGFLSRDDRGKQVPAYLQQLAEHLDQERSEIREELHRLTINIEHIKEIVATQQNYARVLGVAETVNLPELIEDALRIQGGAYERHGITTVREFESVPQISVDKHKAMQILVNLMSNAKYACDATNRTDKKVVLRLKINGPIGVRIEVADNGMGIPKENLTRIFSQGFTTRKGGHGFGLHSGVLAAKELGGALTVHSEGAGQGATFALELPLVPPVIQKRQKT
jgi:PAS domain S-box-containing protein